MFIEHNQFMSEEELTWAKFKEEHPEFPRLYHELFQLIPALVLEAVPTGEDVPGVVICDLMSASLPDFDDILLLCSYDRSWVRGNYCEGCLREPSR